MIPGRPKLGYISEVPGTELRLKINTTSATGKKDLSVSVGDAVRLVDSLYPSSLRSLRLPPKVTTEVAFLRSHTNTGEQLPCPTLPI